MLSPAPATLQHGRDTDRADTEVSSLPGAGRAQTRAAGGLSGALTRDYGSKLRSGHPCSWFSSVPSHCSEQVWGPRTDMSAASSRDIDV